MLDERGQIFWVANHPFQVQDTIETAHEKLSVMEIGNDHKWAVMFYL